MHWMRGQMVCFAELSEQALKENLRVKWQFTQNQLKNCLLDLNKTNESCI